MLIVAALILLFAVGAHLLIRGLRGVAIDDHPLCRQCGFDLVGTPETSKVCSECGADLKRDNATITGHRRRRPRLIVAGIFLALIAIVGSALLFSANYKSFNIYSYYPAWLLAQLMESPSGSTRASAINELISRLVTQNLSVGRVESLADRILALQADAKTAWSPGWGDLLEVMHGTAQLSDDRWQRYASHAMSFELKTRPRVRMGDSLFFSVQTLPPRVANSSVLNFRFDNQHVNIGDLQRDWYGNHSGSVRTRPDPPGMSLVYIPESLAHLKPGPTTLRVSRRVAIAQSSSYGRPFILDSMVTLSAPINLLPSTQSTVALVHEESLSAGVRRAIHVIGADLSKPYLSGLVVRLQIVAPPVGIGFDVFVVIAGAEKKLGSFACAKGKSMPLTLAVGIKDVPGDTIDLIFRSNSRPATETLDTFEIWDGEIRIDQIPVKRPTTAPTQK